MKKILSGAGLVGFLSVARAHDSWAPHTHIIENGSSDLFYLCVAGVVTGTLIALIVHALAIRRDSKLSRVRPKSR